jgi:hypothetical protein
MFQYADSTGGECRDCSVDSAYLTAGFETFRSNGVTFTRSVGTNAVFSSNSSGNWLFDEMNLTIEANSQYDSLSFSADNPIVNINSNISPPDASMELGGTIRNPTIISEGYVNASNDILTGIIVNIDNPNITIEGSYPEDPGSGGLIEVQNATIGFNEGTMIRSDSRALASISGIRCKGARSDSTIKHISVPATTPIENCVFDQAGTRAALLTNNMSNTQYELLYGKRVNANFTRTIR